MAIEMKKTNAVALVLASIMLFSALQVSTAVANPFFHQYPSNPHTIITITSPTENAILPANRINFRFTLNLSLWYPGYLLRYNPTYRYSVSSIVYYIDGKSSWNILNGGIRQNYSYSVLLYGLAEGKHNLRVHTITKGVYY